MIDASAMSQDPAIGRFDSVSQLGPEPSSALSVSRGSYLSVRGWVLSGEPLHAADDVRIRLENEPPVRAYTGLARPDLIAPYGARAGTAGFEAVIPVPADIGERRVSLEIHESGAALVVETIGVSVTAPSDPLEGATERTEGWLSVIDGLRDRNGGVITTDGGIVSLAIGQFAYLQGWAIDVVGGMPATQIIARQGGLNRTVIGGLARADAAADAGIPGAVHCGFAVPLSTPVSGVATVEICAIAADGTYSVIGVVRIACARSIAPHVLPRRATIEARIDEVTIDGQHAAQPVRMALHRGSVIRVRGWAYDAVGPIRSGGVLFRIDDGPETFAMYGDPRPDVAAACGTAAVTACGFRCEVETGTFSAGHHRIQLAAFSGRFDAVAAIGAPLDILIEEPATA